MRRGSTGWLFRAVSTRISILTGTAMGAWSISGFVCIDPNIYPYGQVTRTNWIDEIFRTGSLQRYAVTVNGGSEQLKGYASVEYDKQEGTLLNTYSQDFGAKLHVDFRITDRLFLSERVHFTGRRRCLKPYGSDGVGDVYAAFGYGL